MQHEMQHKIYKKDRGQLIYYPLIFNHFNPATFCKTSTASLIDIFQWLSKSYFFIYAFISCLILDITCMVWDFFHSNNSRDWILKIQVQISDCSYEYVYRKCGSWLYLKKRKETLFVILFNKRLAASFNVARIGWSQVQWGDCIPYWTDKWRAPTKRQAAMKAGGYLA